MKQIFPRPKAAMPPTPVPGVRGADTESPCFRQSPGGALVPLPPRAKGPASSEAENLFPHFPVFPWKKSGSALGTTEEAPVFRLISRKLSPLSREMWTNKKAAGGKHPPAAKGSLISDRGHRQPRCGGWAPHRWRRWRHWGSPEAQCESHGARRRSWAPGSCSCGT